MRESEIIMKRLTFAAVLAGFAFIAIRSSAVMAAPGDGYAAGDQSVAVRAAMSVLSQGGSATDAATAMYFALSVTYPVAAGLGGGGLCVVHDGATNTNDSFDFLPRDAADGGSYAVPGAVRGFALMQAIYGRLPWARAIGRPEALAATGFAISPALALRIGDHLALIRSDPHLAAEFLDSNTNPKPPGAVVTDADLSQTLAAIRQYGASGLYGGEIATKIATDSGKITTAELQAYVAKREPATAVTIGTDMTYMPPARLGAGAFASAMLSGFAGSTGAPPNLAAAVADATRKALVKFAIASLPKDMGATGFVTADGFGQAVACGVTMNGAFGSGHTVPGTGVTLANAPSSSRAGLAPAFLTPAIATDSNDALVLAAAGAGSPNSTAAVIFALVGAGNGIQVNPLRNTGLAPYSTVNAVICQSGACAAATDSTAGVALSSTQ